MDIIRRTVRGVRLTLVGALLSSVVQLATLPVFARLISPHDYGLIAAAMVILTPLIHILCSGIERALIVAADLPAAAIDSILAFELAVAAAAAAAVALAVWSGVPVGTDGTLLVLLTPLILLAAAAGIFRALLRRHLAFGRLVAIDAGAQFAGIVVVATVGLLAGWDSHALAAGMLGQAACQLALYAGFSGHRVAGGFDRRAARPVLTAGLSMTKTSVIEVLHGQMPAAATGWGLGTVALGLYNRASSLVQLPAEFLVGAVTRVAFGSLAQLRGDMKAMRQAAGTVIEACAALLLPVCAGMAPAGDELVAAVLGPQWGDAAALIPWLCLASAATLLAHVFATINEAALALEARFRIQMATSAATAAALALAIGLGLGLVAVVWASAAGAIFYLVMQVRLAARMLGLGPGDLVGRTVPGLTAGCACSILVVVLGLVLPASLAPAWRLMIDIAGCGLATLGVYGLCFPALLARLAGYAGIVGRQADR